MEIGISDTYSPTEAEINQVLAIVPNASKEAIRADLTRTCNVQRTINHVLDGLLDYDELIDHQNDDDDEGPIKRWYETGNFAKRHRNTVMDERNTGTVTVEELSSTDEVSDIDLPAVDFISSQKSSTSVEVLKTNLQETVATRNVSNISKDIKCIVDVTGSRCKSVGGTGSNRYRQKSPVEISDESDDQLFLPAREKCTLKENVDFRPSKRKDKVSTKKLSVSGSDDDQDIVASTSKVERTYKIVDNTVTKESNRMSDICVKKTESKSTLSTYQSWTISSSDDESSVSLSSTNFKPSSVTDKLAEHGESASGKKSTNIKKTMTHPTWCISSSSEDDDYKMPVSLTSRLKQRLQGKASGDDSKLPGYLGSLGSEINPISESQSSLRSNSASETSPSRLGFMKRRNFDDGESNAIRRVIDSEVSDNSSSPMRKKTKRSPEQIEEAKRIALLRKKEKEKEKTQKQQQREEMKLLKERERMQKIKEREEKKMEKEREIARKRAERQVLKVTRPEECIKYVTTILDQRLLEGQGGADVLMHLQSKELKYSLTLQTVENAITWQREAFQSDSQDSQSSSISTTSVDEAELLVILQAAQLVEMVHAYKQEQYGNYSSGSEMQLRAYAMIAKDIYVDKNLTIVVVGIEKYFREQKSKQNKDFRSAVLGEEGEEKKGKRKKKSAVNLRISRVDMEEALVDLQLHVQCNVRFTETMSEAAELIAMFTKAVAEIPFKRERDKGLFSFHVSTEWAGGVKVDKDGKGLLKVWRQQLQQFRNVSVDVASAIVSVYPSPQLLLQAYRKCSSIKEGEKILQDIVVRRGAGVLATSRRVGPELSRRVYLYMTSDDGDFVLHSR